MATYHYFTPESTYRPLAAANEGYAAGGVYALKNAVENADSEIDQLDPQDPNYPHDVARIYYQNRPKNPYAWEQYDSQKERVYQEAMGRSLGAQLGTPPQMQQPPQMQGPPQPQMQGPPMSMMDGWNQNVPPGVPMPPQMQPPGMQGAPPPGMMPGPPPPGQPPGSPPEMAPRPEQMPMTPGQGPMTFEQMPMTPGQGPMTPEQMPMRPPGMQGAPLQGMPPQQGMPDESNPLAFDNIRNQISQEGSQKFLNGLGYAEKAQGQPQPNEMMMDDMFGPGATPEQPSPVQQLADFHSGVDAGALNEVLGQIKRTESGKQFFNVPDGAAGEGGVMQLMPATQVHGDKMLSDPSHPLNDEWEAGDRRTKDSLIAADRVATSMAYARKRLDKAGLGNDEAGMEQVARTYAQVEYNAGKFEADKYLALATRIMKENWAQQQSVSLEPETSPMDMRPPLTLGPASLTPDGQPLGMPAQMAPSTPQMIDPRLTEASTEAERLSQQIPNELLTDWAAAGNPAQFIADERARRNPPIAQQIELATARTDFAKAQAELAKELKLTGSDPTFSKEDNPFKNFDEYVRNPGSGGGELNSLRILTGAIDKTQEILDGKEELDSKLFIELLLPVLEVTMARSSASGGQGAGFGYPQFLHDAASASQGTFYERFYNDAHRWIAGTATDQQVRTVHAFLKQTRDLLAGDNGQLASRAKYVTDQAKKLGRNRENTYAVRAAEDIQKLLDGKSPEDMLQEQRAAPPPNLNRMYRGQLIDPSTFVPADTTGPGR